MAHLDGSARAAAVRAADLLAVLEPFVATTDANMVVEVLRRYGEPEPITLTSGDIAGLGKAAGSLWTIFSAPSTEDAARHLNAILRTYARAPRLSCHDDTPWHLHVDRHDDGPWEEWFASSSAMALATLLAERQTNPAGTCASPRCGRPFIDQGRGDPRRYCSTRCATRERVATHRRTQLAL
jgi:CGNR zinc finger